MAVLVPLIAVSTLLLLFGGIVLIVEYADGYESRQKVKAQRLRERRDDKKKELDNLRIKHARMVQTLEALQAKAQDEVTVSDNVFAHSVLDTIRKEK